MVFVNTMDSINTMALSQSGWSDRMEDAAEMSAGIGVAYDIDTAHGMV